MPEFSPPADVPNRPRLTERAFPPYSYVAGHGPHPVTNPAGHMHGEPRKQPPPLDIDDWRASSEYQWGVDLFNHGYYWEAHEAWESLWHACGRVGTVASFLKGLIKLAAAAVKAREGNPAGVRRHAARAGELFDAVAHDREPQAAAGLSLSELRTMADQLQQGTAEFSVPQPNLLLPQVLIPRE